MIIVEPLPLGLLRIERTLQLFPRLGVTVAFDARHDEAISLRVTYSECWSTTEELGRTSALAFFLSSTVADLPSDSGDGGDNRDELRSTKMFQTTCEFVCHGWKRTTGATSWQGFSKRICPK